MDENEALVPEVVETSVIEKLTRGEVDMQVATAKRFPRSIKRFEQEARTMALKNPAIAASCRWVRPQDGKNIEGPSIRLAEIVAIAWGNLRCQMRMLEPGPETVTGQATVWDMEKNLLVQNEVHVPILTKHGKRFPKHMIVTAGASAISKAYRNAVFRTIPRAHVDDLLQQCKRVALTGAEGGLDGAKRKWIGEFTKQGITKEQICTYFEKEGLSDLDIEDISALQGLHTALSEGATTLDEIFPKAPLADGKKAFMGGYKKRNGEPNGKPNGQPKQEELPKEEPKKAKAKPKPKAEPKSESEPEHQAEPEPPVQEEPDPWVKHMNETRDG